MRRVKKLSRRIDATLTELMSSPPVPSCVPSDGPQDRPWRAATPWRASVTASPLAVALAIAVPLSALYMILAPPSGDLAAATYRSDLFARAGLTLWDTGWYGGHYLPGYSLLAPALGALVGNRTLLAACALASSCLFGLLARRSFPSTGARAASASFALGVCVGLLSGRVAFGLGLSLGLLALLALVRGPLLAALALAALTSLASPVAGAFLALAGLAYALSGSLPRTGDGTRYRSRASRSGVALSGPALSGVALAAAALAPILALALAFPEGGWQLFAPSMFWPVLAAVVLMTLALPRFGGALPEGVRRALTWGAWLYALALIGAFVLRTPVGDNAVRLGALLGAPLAVGLLSERRRWMLAALAPALLYWQLEAPISDVTALAGTPSVNASYYAPLASELQRLAHGRPLRVEVPMTESHWESVYLAEHPPILLARGWERQLDIRYNEPFYRPGLSAASYTSWLRQNAVSYVALPDARLDVAGEQEARLLARGLGSVLEVWRSSHWRLFAVRDPTALAEPPAVLRAVGADSFTLRAPHAGAFTVRLRYTRYWTVLAGHGSVHSAPGGWTEVDAHRAGVIRVGIELA